MVTGVAPMTGTPPIPTIGGANLLKTGASVFRGGSQAVRDASIKQFPKDFQRWYHRFYKGNSRGDATRGELREIYEEWVRMGSQIVK